MHDAYSQEEDETTELSRCLPRLEHEVVEDDYEEVFDELKIVQIHLVVFVALLSILTDQVAHPERHCVQDEDHPKLRTELFRP